MFRLDVVVVCRCASKYLGFFTSGLQLIILNIKLWKNGTTDQSEHTLHGLCGKRC
jgi:dolichyl-phosphate-mannose--protein O-mannosyl transferase